MGTLSEEIIGKSVAAAVSAIEIYNKPDFRYREETFAILMTNAWELLFKAKRIHDNNENPDSIAEFDNVTHPVTKVVVRQVRLNRSGNPLTVGLGYLLEVLFQQANSGLVKPCYENIQALIEVRDNSIHFVNKDLNLSRRVQEIGTASLLNYVLLIQSWFGTDLSQYNFFLMPLSFYHGFEGVKVASVSPYSEQMQNFLDYLASVEGASSEDDSGYRVTLKLETSLMRSKDAGALGIRYTDDLNAPAMNVREEDVLKGYPLTYKALTSVLKSRYTNFTENQAYHDIRKVLEAEKRHCKVRAFYPDRPESSMKTKYYSTEIFKEFDKHYHKL